MWAAIVKKGLSKKKNGTQDVTGGARGPDRHKDREDRGTESSLDVWKIGSNMTFENGRLVDKQQQFRYRNHTNRAGIRQCKRQDGKIAVLLGKKRTYTSRLRTYPRCTQAVQGGKKRRVPCTQTARVVACTGGVQGGGVLPPVVAPPTTI